MLSGSLFSNLTFILHKLYLAVWFCYFHTLAWTAQFESYAGGPAAATWKQPRRTRTLENIVQNKVAGWRSWVVRSLQRETEEEVEDRAALKMPH